MIRRLLCLALLSASVLAKDQPPSFRVVHVELRQEGRLDAKVLESCEVTKIVTDRIQAYRAKSKGTVDLSLRIDRVARVGGNPTSDFGGTEIGITLLSAGGREMNQPFDCRATGFTSVRNPSHCQRLDWCTEKIAGQIDTWLSWKPK